MGGSARYRFMKKMDRLQQKYGQGYNSNPDYLRELDEARQKYAEQRKGELDRAKARNGQAAEEPANSSPYSASYSQERMDNAMWTDDKRRIDGTLRESAGKWWNSLNDDQKKAVHGFTGGDYGEVNRLLGGRFDVTEYGYDEELKQVQDMTSALDMAEIPEDIWVRRGVSTSHINRMFGVKNLATPVTSLNEAIPQAIADERIIDVKNFMSTSAASDSGFPGVEMKIFVPKGSKGVFAEPFSANGRGDGLKWDGVSKQSSYGYEVEVLLQRGYKLKPIAWNPGQGRRGTHQIVFTIVGQESAPVQRQEIDWSKI